MAANTRSGSEAPSSMRSFRRITRPKDVCGIYRDLDRIASLHTDILWLMPIHPIGVVGRKGTLGSPYAISDYRAIHPELGDERSFRTLVDKAHALDEGHDRRCITHVPR